MTPAAHLSESPMTTAAHLSEIHFNSLQLPESLRRGIAEAGFGYCTPIQARTLPLALAGRDVAGQAQTGTGKTAAYLIATYNRVLQHPLEHKLNQPRALILAPTRELAVQIHKDAQLLGKYCGLKVAVVYGGAGYDTQRKQLEEGVDVLIGTPGRLIDYHKQHVFDLRAAQVAVLDEADRMFDLGFIKDVRFLLKRLPPPEQRLNLLFSATLSWRVLELAYEHMNSPELVRIETESVTAERVCELAFYPANNEKIPLLVGLMQQLKPTRAMVFTNTKRGGELVEAYLRSNGIHVGLLSGDVPQKKRLRLLQQFQEGELPVLVATDVAARGLHVSDVTHVFNFDLPQDPKDYVHRIGRTARAGASGDAISFVCETYAFCLPEIEEYIGHRIAAGKVEPGMLAELTRPEHTSAPHRHSSAGGKSQRQPGSSAGSGQRRRRRGPRKDAGTKAAAPS